MSAGVRIAVVLVGLGIWNADPASAQTQAITDGSFEAGGGAWTKVGTVISTGCCPHSPTHYAVMGDVNNATDLLWQQINVPANATSATLSFWRNITSDETSATTAYDYLFVSIQNTSGQILASLVTWSNLSKQTLGVYSQHSYDLMAYRGQSIRVHFLATTDASNKSTFRIDDVSAIYTVPVQRSLSISGQNTGGTIYLTSVPTDILGNVTLPTPSTFTYNDGQSVYLISASTAPNGNHFWKWILDGTDIGYSYTSPSFTMNSNRSIVAAFQLPPPPTLVGPGASSSPGPPLPTLTPTFSWNAVAGASRYGLYISQFPFSGPLVYQNDNVTGTSLVLPAGYLVNGSQYRWDMGTYNSSGQLGSISTELYFQTPPAQRTLSVTAAAFGTNTPIPGVFISSIPADVNGKNLDDTPFDLLYNDGQSVQLIAAATAPNGYDFLAWLLDGNEIGYSFMSEPIPMNSNHTATAVYSPPIINTLVVTSSPDQGALVTANQMGTDGRNSGNTTFELYYEDNTPVCLTAASSHNGKDFVKWQVDGVDSQDGCVVMNADHTLTAIYEESVNPPAAPFLEEVTDAGTGSDIVVRWSHVDPTQVSYFRIEWGVSPGDFSEGSKDVNSGPGTEYRTTIPGLIEHTPYYVAIRAFDAATGLWSATTMWVPAVRPTIPVVLVHGWNRGSPETWNDPDTDDDFAGWLGAAGFNHVWVPFLAPCGGTDEHNFSFNAITLGLFVKDRLQELTDFAEIPVTRVDIVAHSMGGLVARRVINDPQTYGLSTNFSRRLIMLGTPNMGHWLGSVACAIPSSQWISAIGCTFNFCNFCNPASCEMSSGNIAGDGGFNESTPHNPNTEYTVVAGSKCGRLGREEALLITTQAYASEPLPLPPVDPHTALAVSDCFVPVLSVLAMDWNTLTPILNWDHHYVRPYRHEELPRTRDLFDQVVKPILLGAPPPDDIWPPSDSKAAAALAGQSQLPQLTALGLRPITAQSWTQDSIYVGVVNAAYFAAIVSGLSDEPELEVESPSGMIVDSIVAASDSLEYSYFCQGATAEIGVQNPESGYWTIRARARSLPDSTGVCMFLSGVKTSERMLVGISPSLLFVGDTMVISARLESSDAQDTLSSASCDIALSDDSLHWSFALHDDGQLPDTLAMDGVYSAAFSESSLPGIYSVVIQGRAELTPGDTIKWLTVGDKLVMNRPPACGCQCHSDPQCDSIIDIFDVVLAINVAFRDGAPVADPDQLCPWTREDVDCSGETNIFDVVRLINVAFRDGDPTVEFCAPCGPLANHLKPSE